MTDTTPQNYIWKDSRCGYHWVIGQRNITKYNPSGWIGLAWLHVDELSDLFGRLTHQELAAAWEETKRPVPITLTLSIGEAAQESKP